MNRQADILMRHGTAGTNNANNKAKRSQDAFQDQQYPRSFRCQHAAAFAMMTDHLALTNQLSRFARMLDQRDWEAVPSIFVPEISFDYGEGRRQGLPALLAQFRKYLDVCGPTQHLLGSIELQLEATTALTRSYVQARHQGAGGMQDRFYDSHGDYIDHWEKHAAGWLIVRRDVRWIMHRGDPGVLGIQPVQPSIG